jgi:hypothetical protein
MKTSKISMLIVLLLMLANCTAFYKSKTPEGVSVASLCSLPIEQHYDRLPRVAELLGRGSIEPSSNGSYTVIINTRWSQNNDAIFRQIDLCQYPTDAQALEYYHACRKQFTDESNNHNMHKEEYVNNSRYFMSYEPVEYNTNHGIPCGIIDSPRIFICVVKHNLVVGVSYNSYEKENKDNYIKAINDDVLYANRLLLRSLQ